MTTQAAPAATGTPPTAPGRWWSPPSRPAGATAACGSWSSPPAPTHRFATGADELLVLPMEGGGVVECESRRFELAGRDGVFAGVSDFAYVPRDAEVRVSSAGRRPLHPALGAGHLPPGAGLRAGRGGPGRAARGRPGQPAGQQRLHPGVVPGRQDDRRRGPDPRRQLVLLPAAQARRAARRRGRAGGDLLLRGRRPRRPRLPAGLQLGPGPPDRRARRGPLRRRGAGPLRLPRAVDGRPRLRPLLPQRDGRPGRRSGPGASATTRPTPGSAGPGRARSSTPACP